MKTDYRNQLEDKNYSKQEKPPTKLYVVIHKRDDEWIMRVPTTDKSIAAYFAKLLQVDDIEVKILVYNLEGIKKLKKRV